MAAVSSTDGHGGTTDSSKLMTKWGHPMPQNEMPSLSAGPFTPTGTTYGGPATWSEPHQQQNHHPHQQQFAQFGLSQADAAAMAQAESKFFQLSLKAPAFQLQGIPQQAPSGPFTPSVDLGYGTMGAANAYGGGVHVYGGGERMMPGGVPQFVGGGGRAPSMANRGWESSGGANKFAPDFSVAGPSGGGGASHRKFAPFSGPPPPLHSMNMNMMPPRHPPMFGHIPPPPLLTSLNPPHAAGTQFGTMGTFNLQNGTATAIQPAAHSDDSIWQDPNGELRKWQRDTGTSIWGDPAKQSTIPIQRWHQFTADEVVAKSNILAKEGGVEVVESGWGELPPIGTNANAGTQSNSNNNEITSASVGGGTSTAQQFGGVAAASAAGKGGGGSARSNGGWNGGVGAADGGTQQMGAGGWTEQKPMPSNMSQPHGGHFHMAQQIPSSNFVLPAATVPNATGGQPPSLLAMIDSNSAEGDGGAVQRKATSPAQQQQQSGTTMLQTTPQQGHQQTLKVSLAEELSTLGTHGMGSGIWPRTPTARLSAALRLELVDRNQIAPIRTEWYRKWLLVNLVDIWKHPPCINWCYYTQLACPHLATNKVVEFAGHPVFLCKDQRLSVDQRPLNCSCFHPCDMVQDRLPGSLPPPPPSSTSSTSSNSNGDLPQQRKAKSESGRRLSPKKLSPSPEPPPFDFFPASIYCERRNELCTRKNKGRG
uniref:PUM-HD domain-containing protein n=1 Tax=Globodera pallida TaxID=36090 RepID=A0A183C4K0_GLOPA